MFLITRLAQLGSRVFFTCCARIQWSYFWPIMHNFMLLRKLVPPFVPSCGFITTYSYYRRFHTDYYASIMLTAFRDLLWSKLCWHNRPGAIVNTIQIVAQSYYWLHHTLCILSEQRENNWYRMSLWSASLSYEERLIHTILSIVII